MRLCLPHSFKQLEVRAFGICSPSLLLSIVSVWHIPASNKYVDITWISSIYLLSKWHLLKDQTQSSWKKNYGYIEMEATLFTGIPHKEYLKRPLRQKSKAQRNLSLVWTNSGRKMKRKWNRNSRSEKIYNLNGTVSSLYIWLTLHRK